MLPAFLFVVSAMFSLTSNVNAQCPRSSNANSLRSCDWSRAPFWIDEIFKQRESICSGCAVAAGLELFYRRHANEDGKLSISYIIDCSETRKLHENERVRSLLEQYQGQRVFTSRSQYSYGKFDGRRNQRCGTCPVDAMTQLEYEPVQLKNTPDLPAILDAIDRGPLIAVFDVGPKFRDFGTSWLKLYPTCYVAEDEPNPGSHAVILYGYEMEEGKSTKFWMRNSWGKSWGRSGYGCLEIADVNTMNFNRHLWELRQNP